MSEWNYPGARWRKFDFHTHTPASDDFLKRCSDEDKAKVTPEYWLQKFMEKGIDCVAITDHNSGKWIDSLKNSLRQIEQKKPEWYRPLHLFPGVEISAHGGVHMLAIFDPSKCTGDIDSLLGAVGYDGTKGTSCNDVTKESITKVVDIIVAKGGIAIPAHADKKKGLFKLKENTLGQILDNSKIYAMELCDKNFSKPQLYIDRKCQWAEVVGSDTHNFRRESFGRFTWIKMDKPSIEGLRLALIDGEASACRDMQQDPNQHAEYIIESITVEEAKYMGRAAPLVCEFSPFLNTIIGGRGSGKSTLLEFMRLVFRRKDEIPESLKKDSDKYFCMGDEGLLIESSWLSLIYRKGDSRYRLNWSAQSDKPSIEEEHGNDDWKPSEGEVKLRFPVHIYSQKQIFELSKNPQALLRIIDQAPDVNYNDIESALRIFANQYKQSEQKIAEFNQKASERGKHQGALDDIERQIQQIEKSGHKDVLNDYRQRKQQLTVIEDIEKEWEDMAQQIINSLEKIAPDKINEQVFDQHPDILSALRKAEIKWSSVREKLGSLAQDAQTIIADWRKEKKDADWMESLRVDMQRYEQLRTQLEQQGIDPRKYPQLLQQKAIAQKVLFDIEHTIRAVLQIHEDEKRQIWNEFLKQRNELSERRSAFLKNILENTDSVSIKVIPFGEGWENIENSVRTKLHCHGRFDRDIGYLKTIYEDPQYEDVIQKIEALKNHVLRIRSSDEELAKDIRFANHLKSLPLESLSDFMLWFPEDDLDIRFGSEKKSLDKGSPGQKTAALLAFILSYGSEPLLLDQPEDDLDNELIYQLIVKQLREIKSCRQVIVVTHNANIVVNGDAEMVLPLYVTNGQTQIQDSASIQSQSIREKICDVLEGGEQAFEQRYKRIHLEK